MIAGLVLWLVNAARALANLERVDKPRGEFFHTNWTGRGGDTSASTYTV